MKDLLEIFKKIKVQKILISLGLFSLAAAFLELLSVGLIGLLVNSVQSEETILNVLHYQLGIEDVAIILIFTLGLNFCIASILNYKYTHSGYKIIQKVSDQILEAFFNQDLSRREKYSPDKFMAILNTETPRISHAVLIPLLTGISKITIAATMLLVISTLLDPLILYIVGILGIVLLVYNLLVKKIIKKCGTMVSELNQERSRVVNEIVFAKRDIKIFAISDKVRDLYRDILGRLANFQSLSALFSMMPKSIVEILIGIILLVVIMNPDLSMGIDLLAYTIIGFFKVIPYIYGGLQNLLMAFANIHSTRLLKNYLISDMTTRADLENSTSSMLEVEIDDYGLDDFVLGGSLKFENGKSYLIEGDSGSGKTTLVDILSNNIYSKNIILKSNLKSLSYSYVSQNPLLLSGTVKENIEFYIDKLDYVKLDNLISKFFNIKSGEEGKILNKNVMTLSGGECQRIAIIRALLVEANIYVFDEFNSNLDRENTSKAIKIIGDNCVNKICIFIMHNDHDLVPACNTIKIENGVAFEVS